MYAQVPNQRACFTRRKFNTNYPHTPFSQPNKSSYDELLIEEVKKGNMWNEHHATICDSEAEFGKNKYPNVWYDADNYVQGWTGTNKNNENLPVGVYIL